MGAIGVTEADGDSYTFEIVGGEDSDFFIINSDTGELNFIHAPDYESPHDMNGDSTYELIVQVIDEKGNFDRQTILVTIENMIDLSSYLAMLVRLVRMAHYNLMLTILTRVLIWIH